MDDGKWFLTLDKMSCKMSDVAQATFPLYDRILGGTLTQKLVEWTAEGESSTEIAWKLRELDVFVSPMTVKRWLNKIEIDA